MTSRDDGRWQAAEEFCRRRLETDAAFDVAAFFLDRRIGWIETIKSIRRLTECSLHDAQIRVLSNDGWRQWCRRRVERDDACAKQAVAFARHHPDNPFVHLDGGRPVFLDPRT